ncbi:unnamed protein product [Chironomus riparius]|uniref:Uncharacterized protein n=1 Tax=Chironomus riparius TaxID=315576 RepID=A0A9N9RWA1_9DIPT|nr:unnamed protein product [Chironomus riparius]
MGVKSSASIKATSFMMKLSSFFFKSRFPEFFRKCPFKPFTVDRSNITMDSRIIAMIPTGVYRVRIAIKYKNNDMIFDMWLTIHEDYVKLDHAVVYEGNMFSVKASLIKSLDHITVITHYYVRDSKNKFREIFKNMPTFEWLQTDFRVTEFEAFDSDERYIYIEYGTMMNGVIFNFKFRTLEIINDVIVKVRFFVKNSQDDYHEIFKKFPAIDWCKAMKTASSYSSNFVAKSLLLFCKKLAPELMRSCPFPVINFEKRNVTVPNVVLSLVPVGVYRIMLAFKKKNGGVMFNSSLIVHVF